MQASREEQSQTRLTGSDLGSRHSQSSNQSVSPAESLTAVRVFLGQKKERKKTLKGKRYCQVKIIHRAEQFAHNLQLKGMTMSV